MSPGERDDARMIGGKDAFIHLPDEGEDQDEDLHQPHHHQEAVEDVAFFQGIVKIEKSGHGERFQFSVFGFRTDKKLGWAQAPPPDRSHQYSPAAQQNSTGSSTTAPSPTCR